MLSKGGLKILGSQAVFYLKFCIALTWHYLAILWPNLRANARWSIIIKRDVLQITSRVLNYGS